MSQKTAIIIHGGAMKSALAAGFVYGLSKQGIRCYDVALGVSSSVGTAATVATGQYEELRSAWRNDLTTKNFVSIKRLLTGKPVFDVDWLIQKIFRERYNLNVDRLIHGPTTFMTCGYNFKKDCIDFWTSKDSGFEGFVWDSMKSAMTIHPEHGVWLNGYQHTDADLALYKLYENIPIAEGYKTLIVSNHYNQTYTLRKRVGNWIFRFFQSGTFPNEVKKALRDRAVLQKRGLELLHAYISKYGAVMYKPPRNLRVPFWSVITSSDWLMRYYFDQGQKQADIFVHDEAHTEFVQILRSRSGELEGQLSGTL